MTQRTSLRHRLAALGTALAIGLFGIGSLSADEARAAGVQLASYSVVGEASVPPSTARDDRAA